MMNHLDYNWDCLSLGHWSRIKTKNQTKNGRAGQQTSPLPFERSTETLAAGAGVASSRLETLRSSSQSVANWGWEIAELSFFSFAVRSSDLIDLFFARVTLTTRNKRRPKCVIQLHDRQQVSVMNDCHAIDMTLEEFTAKQLKMRTAEKWFDRILLRHAKQIVSLLDSISLL